MGGWIDPNAFGSENIKVDFDSISKKSKEKKLNKYLSFENFIESSEIEKVDKFKRFEEIPILYEKPKVEFTAADALIMSSNLLSLIGLNSLITNIFSVSLNTCY